MNDALETKTIDEKTADLFSDPSLIAKRFGPKCSPLDGVGLDPLDHGGCSGVYAIVEDKVRGSGKYGTVYEACCGSNCDFVAKWQPGSDEVIKEAKLQNIAARNGLAPVIRDVWKCDLSGIIIIMDALRTTAKAELQSLTPEQWEVTLNYYKNLFIRRTDPKNISELLKEYDEIKRIQPSLPPFKIQVEDNDEQKDRKIRIVNTLIDLLESLHNLGISHGDSHLSNFMTNDGGRYYLIDFGNSLSPTKLLYVKKDYSLLYDSLKTLADFGGYTNLKYLTKNRRLTKFF